MSAMQGCCLKKPAPAGILCPLAFLLMPFTQQFALAKAASRDLALASPAVRQAALFALADLIRAAEAQIIAANRQDLAATATTPLADRLRLDAVRIDTIAQAVRAVAALPDGLGEILEDRQMPSGIRVRRIRVPIGVIGMIYESRPNVTIDAAALAIRSGNAIVLKGGKEALHTNRLLAGLVTRALESANLPPQAVQFLDTDGREATAALLRARGLIDLVIPRGGKGLIEFVVTHAQVPVIETGAGVVHTYIDGSADLETAVAVVLNEKLRRPAVCNAVDTLLIDQTVKNDFLARLAQALLAAHRAKGLPLTRLHADADCHAVLQAAAYPALTALKADDLDTEWLDYAMNLVAVPDLDTALTHIAAHSSGHSESIIATDATRLEQFAAAVDSACVFLNTSTAFADGGEFGLGAEIGISTQKLHARGPFALEGLTTYKWLVSGTGQIRP
jgi:glutamate-5-semialdehyde dehydrogenase